MWWENLADSAGLALWGSGLVSALATLVWMLIHRQQPRNRQTVAAIQRRSIALQLSVALFCGGLCLHTFALAHPLAIWVGAVWLSLGLLFVSRAVYLLNALSQGTLDRIEEQETGKLLTGWSTTGAALLVTNVALISLLSNLQTQASDPVAVDNDLIPAVSTLPVPAGSSEGNPPSTVTQAAITTLAPVVLTLDPTTLRVTPTLANAAPPVAQPAAIATLPITTPVAVGSLPTPTPLPVLVVRSAGGANVRHTPALTGEILTILPDGAVAQLVGRTADSAWFAITLTSGEQGWIAAEVVETQTGAEILPVITAE